MSGIAGSGKTLSALKLAKGFLSDISTLGVIQTEAGRAQCYIDQIGEFNVMELSPPFTPDRYVEAVEAAVKAGMKCVIIDSISDEWSGQGGALQMVENGPSKNSFANWKPVTPKHERMFNAILACPIPVICTTKKKSDYVLQDNGRGKQVPVKIGLADIQREGTEYRYMVQFDIDRDTHMATVSKDNTNLFNNPEPFIIDEAVGKRLREWCLGGKK